MKKPINLRPFVFGFLALVLGLLFALSIFISWVFITVFLAALFVGVAFAFRFNLFRKFTKYVPTIIICAIFFVSGFVSMAITESLHQKNLPQNGNHIITGRVSSFMGEESGFRTYFDELKFNGKSVNGTLYVSGIPENTELKIGDHYTLSGNFYGSKHIENGKVNFNAFGYSTIGSFYVNDMEFLHVSTTKWNEKIKLSVLDTLKNNMSTVGAGLSFGMLFGESEFIPSQTDNAFKATGIAHLLAVSGLHIGFLVLLLTALLTLCGVKGKAKFFALGIPLILYAAICGFSSSVTRAAIMCIVSLYAGLRGKQYDGLSALALSAGIILTLNPGALFSISFQMSFSAVFAILCLMRPISAVLQKIKVPIKIGNSLAISVSAGMGVLPSTFKYFGQYATYSVPSNMIIIPIASLAYMFLFPFAIIATIIKPLGFLLVLPDLLLRAVSALAIGVSTVQSSIVQVGYNFAFAISLFAFLFVSSDLYLPRFKYKYPLTLIFFTLAIIFLLLGTLSVL